MFLHQRPMHWPNLFFAASLFAAIFLGYGSWNAWWAVRSASWPGVPGSITHSEVTLVGREGADRANVRYRYAIAGTSYEGSRIGYAVLLSERDAHRFVAAHPAGTQVTVYADPASPTRSTLQRGGATAAFAVTGVGVALAVFAAYARRKSRETA